jgi:hypothetical protein
MMSFLHWTSSGTLLPTRVAIQNCQTSVCLRFVFEDQAAFWAFAYLLVKPPSAAFTQELAFSLENQHHITKMYDFFKNDHGQEVPGGGEVADTAEIEAPPEYDGEAFILRTVNNLN